LRGKMKITKKKKCKQNLDQIDKCIEYLHGCGPLHQLVNIVLHNKQNNNNNNNNRNNKKIMTVIYH